MALEDWIRTAIFFALFAWYILTSVQQLKKRLRNKNENITEPQSDLVQQQYEPEVEVDWIDSVFPDSLNAQDDKIYTNMQQERRTSQLQSSVTSTHPAQSAVKPMKKLKSAKPIKDFNLLSDIKSNDVFVDLVIAYETFGVPRALNPDIRERR